MSEIEEILKALSEPFPPQAIQSRIGPGNKRFSYVATHTVIHRLNDVVGCWDWHITRVDWVGEVMIVVGELTIPDLGTRTGTGVQKVTPGGGEDLFKGAQSDALKNAAKLFGVAIQLYGPDYEDDGSDQSPQPTRTQAPRTAEQAVAIGARTYVDDNGFEAGIPVKPAPIVKKSVENTKDDPDQVEVENILAGALGCNRGKESLAKLWEIIEETQGKVYPSEQKTKWPKAAHARKLLSEYISAVLGDDEVVG